MEVRLKLPNGKDYLSPSSSKQLARHPLSYLAYINDKFTPNDEMIFGQYYEDLLFNVDTSDRFFIYDDEKIVEKAKKEYGKETANIRNTKPYKELKAAEIELAKGKHILTEGQHEAAVKMALIMEESKMLDTYLKGEAQVEKSAVIDTDEYTVKALVRSDVVDKRKGIVVNDLKTTSKEIDGWLYQAKKLDYDIQAYLSYEVWDADDFNFIVQRTKGLYDIGVINVARGGWFYESGKDKFNKAVSNYLEFISPEAKEMGVEPSHYVYYKNV